VRELRDKAMVVEPLRDLYKDQVRVLGRKLGLPDHMVDRHPFPGPGLGIRVLCTETSYREPNHDELQTQLDSFLKKSGYSKYRTHLLPVRTVGVQGDGRSYRYLAGIEGPSNWPELIAMARAIPNNNHAVNRVSYIFGDSVDREALGVTPTHLTPDALEQVRHADAIVTEVLRQYDLMANMSQMPVILVPLDFGVKDSRTIALRPFKTPDFMTGVAAQPGVDIPEPALAEMVDRILNEVNGITRVIYDLSSKPPGTTEWE
ncbi:MAG: hypothetical protein JWL85_449, partial [Candidatus Saccharibacteria bacterium]|nr:hypothetical protein [Candidatus Saccharibacteria bacterium]